MKAYVGLWHQVYTVRLRGFIKEGARDKKANGQVVLYFVAYTIYFPGNYLTQKAVQVTVSDDSCLISY